ncbi:MAG TPA: hypothetical protein VFE24_02950 [Pirellulales bacterium]|nr:hypothetical protein [Pirellulales bacterium]
MPWPAGVILFMAALGSGLTFWQTQQRRRAFFEKFPPLDDAEFLRRCSPGVNPDVALRVRRIMSDQLGVEYCRVYPDPRLVEDLGCS